MTNRMTHGRSGWNSDETQMLWEEVERCSSGGEPLRAAFDRIALKTGRKSNSIRNYYYAMIKTEGAPEGLSLQRAAPFVPFTAQEVRSLLREVLRAQGQGQSVRACVQRLSQGDRSAALRLQNKYRSLLKSHPELVREVMAELRAEKQPCVDPYRKGHSLPRESQSRAEALSLLTARLRTLDPALCQKLCAAILEALDVWSQDASVSHPVSEQEELERYKAALTAAQQLLTVCRKQDLLPPETLPQLYQFDTLIARL